MKMKKKIARIILVSPGQVVKNIIKKNKDITNVVDA